MPRLYPPELRWRVLAAVDVGRDSQTEIAARFGVSVGWVEKILRQRRRAGHVTPACLEHLAASKHGGGASRRVTPPAVKVIRTVVTAEPAITLARLGQEVQRQTGVQVSVSRLWHWIKELGLRRLRKSSAGQRRGAGAALRKPPQRRAI